MKKKIAAILTIILLCCSSLNVQAKYLDVNTYSICKNDIFIDVENMNVKKIVTEVYDDGKFLAEDLADWMKDQEFYSVTEIKSNGVTQLLYYEFDMDKEDETSEIANIDFENLIVEGDIIKFSDSTMEKVVFNAGGGNFYTKVSDEFDFAMAEDTNGDVLKSFIGENGLEIVVHTDNEQPVQTDDDSASPIILEEPSEVDIGSIIVSDGIKERVIALGENDEYITEIID